MSPGRSQQKSIALHRVVAERIRSDAAVLDRARNRVSAWRERDLVAPFYGDAWAALLATSVDEICAALVRDDETMATLRQVTPFAGALGPRERWRILAELET